jgi:hypothetical protein
MNRIFPAGREKMRFSVRIVPSGHRKYKLYQYLGEKISVGAAEFGHRKNRVGSGIWRRAGKVA